MKIIKVNHAKYLTQNWHKPQNNFTILQIVIKYNIYNKL